MQGQTTTHATLLARIARGDDPAAWRELEARYGELIRGFARRRGLQASDCDDIAQEVLLALTRNMPGFAYDPARGRFRGYLKTIAVRAISRKLRQEQGVAAQSAVDEAAADALDDPAAEEHWEAEWRQHHLRLAMGSVRAETGEQEMAAFDAYVGEGRDPAEVASALGVSVDVVYQAKSRVLKRLRAHIARQTAEEG